MKVPFIDLSRHHKPLRNELLRTFENVLDSNQFILGDAVKQFETELVAYTGARYAIGVSNCTHALLLSLKACGIGSGDEVITTPFSFIATAEVIALLGATPVFCDIDPKTFNIDTDKIAGAISSKTKALMPVHLYGQAADMDKIMHIAREKNLKVIEDMAQAIGAKYRGKMIGTFGDTACISFFPTKNLSALGDAGLILTNNSELEQTIRILRVHGASKKYYHDSIGFNDRLDAVQAAFLHVKLKYLDTWNERRRQIAKKYDDGLRDVVMIPYIEPHNESIYHQYTIRTSRRDDLRDSLSNKGIGTAIHYPLPLHLQNAFQYLNYSKGSFPESEKAAEEVLCLPIYQDLTDEEVEYIIDAIKQFFS
ncbi:MAG: transcriptional regulator [Theionarchaea archaeon DG-70]|nr:MAG: transcriptional regulator [Theionarchaea archaeon DG-70]